MIHMIPISALNCKENEVFEERTSGCENSCSEPDAEESCPDVNRISGKHLTK